MNHILPGLFDKAELGRLLIDAAGDAILVVDACGIILDCNPASETLFGCTAGDLIGSAISTWSTERQPDGRPSSEAAALIGERVQAGHTVRVEWVYRRADGRPVESEVTLAPVRTGSDGFRIVIARDISERKAMEQRMLLSEQKFVKLFEISPDPMIVSEIQTGLIHDVNLSFITRFGFAREAVVGRTTVDIGLWKDTEQRTATVTAMREKGQLRNHEVDFRTTTGEVVTVLGSSAEVMVDGKSCWLVQFKDITERKAHLQAMEFLALHDPLTRLPNRKRLHEVLAAAIRRSASTGEPFSLMLLDLNRFKEVNDALGHHVGDELLKQVAARLSGSVDGRDGFVARLGGDEFAVVLPGAGPDEARAWACGFLHSLRVPFPLGGMRLEVGASIGLAVHPADGSDGSTLLRCADVAMYVAKRTQSGFSHYATGADTNSKSRLLLMADLGEAIAEDQLILHYQPIVRLADGSVSGFEALVRWRHPAHGLVPPAEFIPLAEMSDLIRGLTARVLDGAVAQMRSWWNRGPNRERDWRVAVNLSARNLVDETLPEQVRTILAEYGVDPERLELEITETAMMADPDRAIAILRRLVGMGVEIAIDDFGTGYSSFTMLRRLPGVTSLKIDQSFVRRMLGDPADAAVVETMVDLATRLGVRVVAEGVEDAETLTALRNCGCVEAQGYHIARPMEAAAVPDWYRGRAPNPAEAPSP